MYIFFQTGTSKIFPLFNNILRPEVPSVEAREPGELEDRVVILLFNLGAPVPSRRESAVDAGSGVEEIVGARTVE